MAARDNNAPNDGMPMHHQMCLVLKLAPWPLVNELKVWVTSGQPLKGL